MSTNQREQRKEEKWRRRDNDEVSDEVLVHRFLFDLRETRREREMVMMREGGGGVKTSPIFKKQINNNSNNCLKN
jgi:hypothetical protein